jgi:DNA-binding MarR family transcriptional regulator
MSEPLETLIPDATVAGVSEELASRLRLSINRLHRLLRQESLAGPTLGELASIEQVQPPTMTKIVASLADAGMVTRVTDVADRRSARVRITPAGKRSMERIRTLKNAFLTRRLAEFSPEEQAGAAALVDLLEHLVGQ